MRWVIVFLANYLLVSCVEIIDFETNSEVDGLIFHTILSQSNQLPHTLTINRVSNDPSGQRPMPYLQPQLIDDLGNTWNYEYLNDDKYRLPPIPELDIERCFFLSVTIDDALYQSSLKCFQKVTAKDEAQVVIEEKELINEQGNPFDGLTVEVSLNTMIPPLNDDLFLRYDLMEIYSYLEMDLPDWIFPFESNNRCFITREPYLAEIPLLRYPPRDQSIQINQRISNRQLDEKYRDIYLYAVIQHSINSESYKFWNQVNEVTNRSGSIFETPPARVIGNMKNMNDPNETVYGIFDVSTTDTVKLVYRGITDEYPRRVFTQFDFCRRPLDSDFIGMPSFCYSCLEEWFDIKPYCYDCSQTKNASVIRPSIFPE